MIDAGDSETQEGLEKGEIIADTVGFMLAGYETTSTTLTFATYLLAANPEVQERLANEIHEYFEENPVSDVHMQFCGFVHARDSALQTAHKCLYANGTGLGYPRDWLTKDCSCICLYTVQVELRICQVVCVHICKCAILLVQAPPAQAAEGQHHFVCTWKEDAATNLASLLINPGQDVLTRGSLSTAYR